MKIVLTAILLSLSFATAAYAQPAPSVFGITMGTPLAQLSVIRKLSENVYTINVPTPHYEFDVYTVLATPGHGVCKIIGSGVMHRNDKYGAETRTAYNRVKEGLTEKYGKSRTLDFIRAGSIWNGAHEWAASIEQKERTFEDYWFAGDGSTLPQGLDNINLEVKATSLTNLFLMISYEFSNFKSCRAADFQRSNKGL